MLTVVADGCPDHEGRKDRSPSLIDEIVREGARRMLAEALRAEVDAYIAAFAADRGEDGRRLVVRNGYHQSREVLTSAGAVEVTVPRVDDRRTDPATGERMRFCSAIVRPWARKTPKVTEVLPLLYLHGLSSGDFVPALGQFLGSSAGLSAPVITRLTETWRTEQRAFAAWDLSGADYVCLWADGMHVRRGHDRLWRQAQRKWHDLIKLHRLTVLRDFDVGGHQPGCLQLAQMDLEQRPADTQVAREPAHVVPLRRQPYSQRKYRTARNMNAIV
jgi:Transposase, Mutator family